jgi:hypothetical protein
VKRALKLIATLAALTASVACAQELEPRAYTNLPVGLNFLAMGYAQSRGSLSTDPSLPIEDAELTIHTGLAAYARALDLWGNSGKFDVILPYSRLTGSAVLAGERLTREVSGLGDPRVRLSMNLYGAPALSAKEYAAYKPDLVVGASLQVAPPLGQYDPERAVNLGSGRWSTKADIGFSKSFAPLTVDLTAGVIFFSNNDDYFGGKQLKQEPVYVAQTNLSYDFGGGVWAALGYTYYMGGRTTLDGVEKDDELGNSRVGLTLAVPIDRNYSLKFNASTGVVTRIGTGFDIYGVILQYRWGAGL